MMKAKEKGEQIKPSGRNWMTRRAYSMFGRTPLPLKSFKGIYERSGIGMFYQAYTSLMFLSLLLSAILTFLGAFLVHSSILHLMVVQAILSSAILSFLASCLVLMPFLFIPVYRRSQRGKEIDSKLVHTVSYLAVLSTAGLSVGRIFERVFEVENHGQIRELLKRIVRNTRVFGLDIVSSLEEAAQHSPSDTFSKLMGSVVNTVKISGNLRELFMFEARRLLAVKRNQLERVLGTLTYLGEIYVAAIVVSPIVMIIMLTILSLLGGNVLGLPPVAQMNIAIFLGIPSMAAVFLVVFDALLPEEA